MKYKGELSVLKAPPFYKLATGYAVHDPGSSETQSRVAPTRVVKCNLADSGFETLSAQKICINRGLLACAKAAQNVSKRHRCGVVGKI